MKQEQPLQCVQSCGTHPPTHRSAVSTHLWMKAAEDQQKTENLCRLARLKRPAAWPGKADPAPLHVNQNDPATHRASGKAMPQKHDATWCRCTSQQPYTNSSLPKPRASTALWYPVPCGPNPHPPPRHPPEAVNSTLRHKTVRGPAWQQGMGAVNALSETLTQNG